MTKENKKIEWIVVLRSFACLAVIMLHVIDGWTSSANISLVGGGVKMVT